MSSTEANEPSAIVAALDRFTIYSTEHRTFATRYNGSDIRIVKPAVDPYCIMTLLEHVPGTNKIRFSLDTGAVVFRHSERGNLHSRSDAMTNSDTFFELIPR